MSSSIATQEPRVAAPAAGGAADEHRDRRPRRPRQEHGHRPPAGRHPLAARGQARAGAGALRAELASRSSTPSCSTRSRTSRRRASPSTPPGCSSRATCAHYLILDAPGHIEFLKNMITGAARAEAALLVIDAAEGVQENSRRHGYMMSLLGIRQLAVLVNKMDLVGWDRAASSTGSSAEYGAFLDQIGIRPACFIPVSARGGDNIADRSAQLPLVPGPDGARCARRVPAASPRRSERAVPHAGPGRLQVHQAGRRPPHRRRARSTPAR